MPKRLKAGRGLFAKKNFHKGDIVTYYDFDKVVDDNGLQKMKINNDPQYYYVIRKRKNENLCGLMNYIRGRGMGSLINSGGGIYKNNCKLIRCKTRIYIKVVASYIKKGEELFIPYNRGVIARSL